MNLKAAIYRIVVGFALLMYMISQVVGIREGVISSSRQATGCLVVQLGCCRPGGRLVSRPGSIAFAIRFRRRHIVVVGVESFESDALPMEVGTLVFNMFSAMVHNLWDIVAVPVQMLLAIAAHGTRFQALSCNSRGPSICNLEL